MFTGIVTEIGMVQTISGNKEQKRLSIHAKDVLKELNIGDSIAINGVCLTVTDYTQDEFSVDVVAETLRVTNLGDLFVDDKVNLEPSLPINGKFGGHIVQGHVDGVAEIVKIEEEGNAWLVEFTLPKALAPYVVHKGFITIDGMSITVIEARSDSFTATFIPHTREVTIVKDYQVGNRVNIEVDLLAKYVERILGERNV